jgi:protein transport protein SEC39
MADLQSLSAAHIIVLATELCSRADFEGFQALQHLRPDVLGAEICCRILLTVVSENEHPDQYVPLLKQLRGTPVGDISAKTIEVSSVEELSEEDVRRRIRYMRLERLKSVNLDELGADDIVARFVIQQAYKVDAETGDLPAILQLVEPFVDGAQPLRRWLISNLLPLLRLDYEYYSEGSSGIPLAAFQDLEGGEGLDLILQRAKTREGKPYIARDLRGVVGPWMYGARSSKRRKLSHGFRRSSNAAQDIDSIQDSGWQDVNEWILKTSLDDHDLAMRAVSDWDGPKDVDLGGYEDPAQSHTQDDHNLSMKYAQAALATAYAVHDTYSELIHTSFRILQRVASIAKVEFPQMDIENQLPDCSAQSEAIITMPRSTLNFDALLEPNHALTWPSTESLVFLQAILTSIRILKDDLHCQQQLSCRSIANLSLFATEQVQRQELHKTLQNFARIASAETDWRSVREKVLWLSRWRSKALSLPHPGEQNQRALFGGVTLEDVETEIFSAMLTAKQYKMAIALYLADADSNPLPSFLVEKIVEHEILNVYDNASNGNRTRGGLKRASEILKAFGPYFSPSSPVNKIEHLLAATHSLSFYQLTLQHGVPFQPVSIRVHHDPISLISKVLEQNSKAYTKLDDLLSIGRGMVAAGLPTSSTEDDEPATPASEDNLENKMLESDHRITHDATISALSSNDFDTAYSYILTSLSPSPQLSSTSTPIDDTSWRAAYAAGRHRLPPLSSPSEKIATLSKKMELLSLALTLVPDPSPLPSMLAVWPSCEDEFNALRAREAAEEKAWDDRGDNISSVPGGFGLEGRDIDIAETRRERERRRAAKIGRGGPRGRFDGDEAPIGLFDVARGAARAIGKSAFPLREVGGVQSVRIGESEVGQRSSDEYARGGGSGDEGQNRVRKRDMVSNMVTGGLVNGLGWVLGAQPVNKDSQASPVHDESRAGG